MDKTFDRYGGIVFLAIGVLFMIESFKIKDSAYGSSVGPGIFPLGLGFLLTLLSIRLIYETFQYQQSKTKKRDLDYKRFSIILVASILYCLFLDTIGYIISTFLFLLVGFQAMKRGKFLSSLLISAAFSVGVFYVFNVVLKISLPSFPTWLSMVGGFS